MSASAPSAPRQTGLIPPILFWSAVGKTFGRQAQLTGGTSTFFRTANGDRPGRIVEGIPVQIGPVEVNRVRIGIGLSVGDDNQALLGQSFLSKFDVILGKDQMVLKPR
ncbi:hypothetical protein os4_32080 [Comamonadaceae bacterium OS-4]|nr:hypothetical protein os4_32080 [Comamonadaceae bacterium OS-4]